MQHLAGGTPDRGAVHIVCPTGPGAPVRTRALDPTFDRTEPRQGNGEHACDLADIDGQHRGFVHHPDEWDDQYPAHERVDGGERARNLNRCGLKTYLFPSLSERGSSKTDVLGFVHPTREGDLARMAREVIGTNREYQRGLGTKDEWEQHRRQPVAGGGFHVRIWIEAGQQAGPQVRVH